MTRRLPWYQLPKIWAGIVAGLVAFGATVVWLAEFINVPKVAAENRAWNERQDDILHRLTILQEQWEQVYQQQQTYTAPTVPSRRMPAASSPVWTEWYDGELVCTDGQQVWWPDTWGDC